MDLEMVLHTDQGSVYSSEKFKEASFIDFNINMSGNIYEEIDRYIHYFNYERHSCVLNYPTPIQYREKYWSNIL